MNRFYSFARTISAFAPALALVACAKLVIDVDVYKGPLANEQEVQERQVSVMAIGAKPLLVNLRDRLEWRDEREEMRQRGWYQDGYIPDPAHLRDEDAIRVNAILSLYESRRDPELGANIERGILAYRQFMAAYETFIPRDPRRWAMIWQEKIAPYIYRSVRRNSGDLDRGHPLSEEAPEIAFRVNDLAQAYHSFFCDRGRESKRTFQDGSTESVWAERWVLEASDSIVNLVPIERIPFQSGLDALRASRDSVIKERELFANPRFQRLLDRELLVGHAELLFPNRNAEARKLFIESVEELCRSFLECRGALRRLGDAILELLIRINTLESDSSLDIKGITDSAVDLWISIVSTSTIKKAIERAATNPETSTTEIQFLLPTPQRGTGDRPAPEAPTEVELQQEDKGYESKITDRLRKAPIKTAEALINLQRQLLENKLGRIQGSGWLGGAGFSPGPQDPQPISGRIKEAETASHELQTKLHSLSLGKGRLDAGLEEIIDGYLKKLDARDTRAHSDPSPHERYDVEINRHRERLFGELTRFAQKVLFIANNDRLLSSRNDPDISRYIRVLQSVGNSILIQVDELENRARHQDSIEDAAATERRAIRGADARTGDEVLKAFVTHFRGERDEASSRRASAQAMLEKLEEALRSGRESLGISTLPSAEECSAQLGRLNGLSDFLSKPEPSSQIELFAREADYGTLATHLPKLLPGTDLAAGVALLQTALQARSQERLLLGNAIAVLRELAQGLLGTASDPGKASLGAIRSRLEASPNDFWHLVAGAKPPAATPESTAPILSGEVLSQFWAATLSLLHPTLLESYKSFVAESIASMPAMPPKLANERTCVRLAKLVALWDANIATQKAASDLESAKAEAERTSRAFDLLSGASPALAGRLVGLELPASPEFIRQMLIDALENDLAALPATPTEGPQPSQERSQLESTIAALRKITPRALGEAPFSPPTPSDDSSRATGESAKAILDEMIALLRHQHLQALREFGEGSAVARNAASALRAAYEQRSGMIYIRPASAYLRSSFPATTLQEDEDGSPLTTRWRRENREIQREIDKQFWQTINRVVLRGVGRTNYVVAKDDVGNWYAKEYSTNPEDIIKSAQTLAMFAVSQSTGVNYLSPLARRIAEEAGKEVKADVPKDQSTLGEQMTRSRATYVEATAKDLEAVAAAREKIAASIETAWSSDTELSKWRDQLQKILDGAIEQHLEPLDDELETARAKGASLVAREKIIRSMLEGLRQVRKEISASIESKLSSDANLAIASAVEDEQKAKAAKVEANDELVNALSATPPEEARVSRAREASQKANQALEAASEALASARAEHELVLKQARLARAAARRAFEPLLVGALEQRQASLRQYEDRLGFIGESLPGRKAQEQP